MDILSILASSLTILTTVFPFLARWRNKALSKEVKFYTSEDIERSTECYVQSDCQEVDPAYSPESNKSHSSRRNVYSTMDEMLNNPSKYKYIILLGDTGIGKTSFILNYYTRYLCKRKRFRLRIVPLSRMEADDAIKHSDKKPKTVLFLDALDEDVRAIGKIQQRVKELCHLTEDFRSVLITCRTQFFPHAIEEPDETGVMKIRPVKMGETGGYNFEKRYLTPFNKIQIEEFLKLKYSYFQRHERDRARSLIRKSPHLTARPMILAYIDDLLHSKNVSSFSFQIYETIIQAWLRREVGRLGINYTMPLNDFSEQLALELYRQRQERGSECLPFVDIEPLARQSGIKLENWKLTGRSLLNRDADDNFKFAHRSIMEYLFVKRFLALPVTERPEVNWTDQMYRFLWEMIQRSLKDREPVTFTTLDKVDIVQLARIAGVKFLKLQLRQQPKTLLEADINKMLDKYNFFDSHYNKKGLGVSHVYVLCGSEDEKVVIDYTTGLMWQQSGSTKFLKFTEAQQYVRDLNKQRFAGYSDWRLPTLEEAMSLIEPEEHWHEESQTRFNFDPVFDGEQSVIWIADKNDLGKPAYVFLSYGSHYADADPSLTYSVCAVRSINYT